MPTSIMAAAAVGGLIMSGVGMFNQQSALSKQKEAQSAAVGQQTSAIQGMNAAQNDEIVNQQAVEAERQKQMDLEYKRQQLQTVRNWQSARAMSLATATSQGAGGQSQSSALSGAYGNESGAARTQMTSATQNYQIGTDIFAYNKNISNDRIQYGNYNSAYNIASAQFGAAGAQGAASAGAGAGMMSMGGSMISSAATFGNVAQSTGGMLKNGFSFGTGPGAWMS